MLLHWVQPQNHMHIHPTKIMMGKLLDSKIYQSTQAKNCPTLITSAYKTKHDELDILLYSSQNCTEVMLVSIASTGLIWLVPNSLPSWTIGCSGLSFNLFSTNPKLDQPKSLLLLHPKTGLQQIKNQINPTFWAIYTFDDKSSTKVKASQNPKNTKHSWSNSKTKRK